MGAFAAGVSYFAMKWLAGYVVGTVVAGLDMITLLPFEAYSDIVLYGFLSIGIVSGIIGSTISIRRPMDA